MCTVIYSGMKSYIFNSKRHYMLNDIRDHGHKLFIKLRGLRPFIEKYKLVHGVEYVIARKEGGAWTISNCRCLNIDKYFILAKWIHDYDKVFTNEDSDAAESSDADSDSDAAEPSDDSSDDSSVVESDGDSSDDSDDDTPLEDNQDIVNAPPKITFTDRELFRGNNNKPIDIETRGCREKEGCYFLASDASVGFKIPALCDTLLNTKNGYFRGMHYEYFDVPDNNSKHSKMQYNRELFVTFMGLMRVIHITVPEIVGAYTNWTDDVLFCKKPLRHKPVVASKSLGASFQIVFDVFSRSSTPIPGIYIIYLGKVVDLRKAYNIPSCYGDNESVYKFGRTDDLNNRFHQHYRNYVEKRGYDIKLSYYCVVDSTHLCTAETNFKHYLLSCKYKLHESSNIEIAIYPDREKKIVRRSCESICKPFIGSYSEIAERLKRRDCTIKLLEERIEKNEAQLEAGGLKLELAEERYNRKLLEERSKRKISEKELEICELKLELATKRPSKSSTTKRKSKSKR